MEKTDIIERHTKALESVVGLSGLSKIECQNIIRDAVNEALNMAGVVGRSEQFYCDQEKTIKRCKNQCMRCNKFWKPKKQ
tara:strand:- start:629 stop:868 length:240 start_codon:yes stop_codon:yes gene_type:complete